MLAGFEYDGQRIKVVIWGGYHPRHALGTVKPRDYPEWRGMGGENLMHKAAAFIDTTALLHVLGNGCGVLVNVPDNNGVLPLSYVSQPEHLRLLLEEGADPNLPSGRNGGPVGFATLAYRRSGEMLEMLVSAGLRLEGRDQKMTLLPDPFMWCWSMAALVDQKNPDVYLSKLWWLEERTWPWRTEDDVHETRWRVYFRHSLVWQLLIGLAQIQRAPVKR